MDIPTIGNKYMQSLMCLGVMFNCYIILYDINCGYLLWALGYIHINLLSLQQVVYLSYMQCRNMAKKLIVVNKKRFLMGYTCIHMHMFTCYVILM